MINLRVSHASDTDMQVLHDLLNDASFTVNRSNAVGYNTFVFYAHKDVSFDLHDALHTVQWILLLHGIYSVSLYDNNNRIKLTKGV